MYSQVIYCIIITFFCACSSTTYWTAEHELPQGRIDPCEIIITDSTYTICSYDIRANHGEIQTFNAEFIGDTLLVYDVQIKQNEFESDTFICKRVIVEAFVQKGRKLLPLYWYYPTVYPKRNFSYYYERGEFAPPDRSAVISLTNDWLGAKNDTMYMNLNGYYHRKGKHKSMRNMIQSQNNGTDSTLWEMKKPTKYINDSSAIPSGWLILHGTLKTKNGDFIDLR